MNYVKGLGVFVGRFNEADLTQGSDKKAVQKAKEETGYKFTNTRIIKKGSKPIALDIWVCTAEDFKI